MDNVENNIVNKTVMSSQVVIEEDAESKENVRVKTSINVAIGLTDEQSYECLKSIIASYAEFRAQMAVKQGKTFDKRKFINSLVIDLQLL